VKDAPSETQSCGYKAEKGAATIAPALSWERSDGAQEEPENNKNEAEEESGEETQDKELLKKVTEKAVEEGSDGSGLRPAVDTAARGAGRANAVQMIAGSGGSMERGDAGGAKKRTAGADAVCEPLASRDPAADCGAAMN